jgi:hypothetical protein
MKKYIREMLRELTGKNNKRPTTPEPTMADDLNNQELSKDPLQKTRQLDYQAQRDEERQSS